MTLDGGGRGRVASRNRSRGRLRRGRYAMRATGGLAGGLLALVLVAACSGAPARAPAAVAPVASDGTGAAGAVAASPEPGPLPKVTISYSSISGTFLPLWIAVDEGLFAKHGLDV